MAVGKGEIGASQMAGVFLESCQLLRRLVHGYLIIPDNPVRPGNPDQAAADRGLAPAGGERRGAVRDQIVGSRLVHLRQSGGTPGPRPGPPLLAIQAGPLGTLS